MIAFGDTSPKWRSNLGLGWAKDSWTVDGYVKQVSKFNSYTATQTLDPVKGYTTVAGRVAYELKSGITLALNGQNLMRESQAQTKGVSGLQAERRVIVGLTKRW